MKTLFDELSDYSKDNYYPMHMPGHKRNTGEFSMNNPYGMDITEIEGFDNLHDAQGILKDAMERAAHVYGSEETHFLINGSTVGILTGIAACTRKGDRILMARNCHKAVYNAVYLNELRPVYLYPQYESVFGINGGISAEKVKEMLITFTDIKLIVITSPTYEGIVSDVKAIVALAHEKGIPVLVDEAHGAHFGFHPYFPESAMKQGADLVIHSVHKTLPSFTQTALLHVNGSLVPRDRVRQYLSIYQTSSPSYLLMGSIDRCMALLEDRGYSLFEQYKKKLEAWKQDIKQLKKLSCLSLDTVNCMESEIAGLDPSKLVISVKHASLTGPELYEELLNSYKIQMELVSKDYVLGMTSICDTEEGFHRLRDALLEIDQKVSYKVEISERKSEKISERKRERIFGRNKDANKKENEELNGDEKTVTPGKNPLLTVEISPYEAYNKEGESVPLEKSEGHISKEYAYLYPPGIPLVVPGERISTELVAVLADYKKNGLSIKGLKKRDYIEVVKG